MKNPLHKCPPSCNQDQIVNLINTAAISGRCFYNLPCLQIQPAYEAHLRNRRCRVIIMSIHRYYKTIILRVKSFLWIFCLPLARFLNGQTTRHRHCQIRRQDQPRTAEFRGYDLIHSQIQRKERGILKAPRKHFYQIFLFQHDHLLGLGIAACFYPVEIHSGWNEICIPNNLMITSLLFSLNQRFHFVAENVVDINCHSGG